MRSIDIEIFPRFFEVDSFGVVNHAFYFSWFELSRFAYFKSKNITFQELEKENILFMVIEARVKYKKSVKFGEKVIVKAVMEDIKGPFVLFKHYVEKDKEIVAEGEVKIGCVKDGKLVRSIPENILKKLTTD